MNLGKEIYRTYDEYGSIEVFDDGNKRYLTFGETEEQSCALNATPAILEHEYIRAMCVVLLFQFPKTVTLLGLGGGGLATFFHKNFPEAQIQAVEVRKEVIRTAYRFFYLPRDERLKVHNMDAFEFVNQGFEEKTDVLFCDLYGEEGMDARQLKEAFIDSCAEVISEGGWLVLNFWDKHRFEKTMLSAVKRNFADIRYCSTNTGNWILFAGKKSSELQEKELKNLERSLSECIGFSLATPLSRLKKWK